jgi:hypothetical protein
LAWLNARDGFEGTVPFWAFESHNGDSLNSFDTASGTGNATDDYSAAFGDFKQGDLIPSRRLKAWYQGSQDFRAIAICRELIGRLKDAGESVADFDAELAQILERTPESSAQEMEQARWQLLRLATRMQLTLSVRVIPARVGY